MKILLTIIFNFVFTIANCQQTKSYKVTLNFPTNFHCDSIILINENTNELIKKKYEERIITYKDFLKSKSDKDNIFSLYLKNNSLGIRDTIFFIFEKKDGIITFNDTLNELKSNPITYIKNLYNFQYYYYKYTNLIEKNEKELYLKYSKNIAPKDEIEKLLSVNLAKIKLGFVRKTITNPYANDLFYHFMINDINIDYKSINDFYYSFLEKNIPKKNRKNYEQAIQARTISNTENFKSPHFIVKTIDGKTIDNYLIKDSCILLTFWATWCGPCMEELPAVKEISEIYSNKNLKIISISLDNNYDKFKKIIEEKGMNWEHIYGDRNILSQFGVSPIPHVFLIDKNGIVIYNSMARKNEMKELSMLKVILKSRLN